ncbi:kinase-like protein, partial [Fistulina hepatica ATCC 64428]
AEDLMKGLAFLHRHNVAHRDIKPDNLVYTDAFRLELIDFDVAIRVWGAGQLVEEDVGTDQYKAPEMRDGYGRPQAHSPIRADRWSCGCVI